MAFPLLYGLYSRRLTGGGALFSSLAGLAFGLAYFPELREYTTAIPVVGGHLPAADPLYLTSFAGAFIVSTILTLLLTRLSTPTVDDDSLTRRIRRLEEAGPDGSADD